MSSAALLLDGENVNSSVQIVSQQPGTLANAPAGAIREFGTDPFPNASVINISPLTTGLDEESDDDYRDRIKKERLSRGLGTALAVKNAVLGAQAPDENARVTSNEIDTSNPEETILYIDNGNGYEEKSEGVGFEFVVDSAIGGEQSFQLSTGGSQTSVAKAFLQSSNSSPFDIRSFEKLSILVGGIVSEHAFTENAFQAQGAATAFEIVANINDNPNLTFEATTAESGTKVVIKAKSENDEFLEMTSPSSGIDAAPKLNFPSNEVNTVLLYRNRELLNKNGRSAFITTKNQFSWSNSITGGDTLIISVDGTDPITYTFLDQDFQTEGQQSTVSNQNTLSSWANVINAKVTGVTAEVNSEQLKLTSNLGSSNRASISVDPTSDLVLKGMFSPELGLFKEGNEADFQISRNTAQIKLNTPLSEGETLNLGSEFTRAEIQSTQILGGQTTLSGIGYIWLIVDGTGIEPVETGVTGDTFLDVTKPGGNIVRYESTNLTAFNNVQVGDYVNIWSDELSATNRLEGRVNAVTSSTLDIKVTAAEEAAAVIEGPIFFSEGFTVLRTVLAPQKIKIPAGVYNINEIASIMNSQLDNASVTIDNDEIFVFRTNTESTTGSVYLADFNDPAKALNLIKNSSSQSIASQSAFYETGFKDRQFPAFVHGKITADAYADPSDSYINAISVSEDLSALGLDPSGFVCLAQPYSDTQDILSSDCIEIERYTGSVVNLENSYFYKRSRIDDRFYVLNPYDFGHNDSLVTVLDDDPTGKTFDMPLYRTAVTNITATASANNFRAYDVEGGDADFTQFFGTDFKFDNYKALMQAKNVIDPLSLTDEDAILYRSVEWGRSGEKFGVGYYYPTTPDSGIQHIVTVTEQVNIKLFLKSGPARTTTINGTTEWNITTTPAVGYELITYAYSGEGAVPGLDSISSGDYVSIINTGEFSSANQGAYRVDSATTTSFTIRRATGEAETQSNVASLEINTISFFEPADTTAQEIVDYVTLNLTDHITSEIIDDNGLSGAGIINQSTAEDSNFAYEYVYFKDGKNYLLSSDIASLAPAAQFTFKTPLDLPTFSTNTVEAYSFNNGEEVKIVPVTSLQLKDFLNVLAVTGYTTIGKIESVNRNSDIQLSTDILGTEGAVQIAGGTGSSAAAAVQGSASTLGSQDNESSIITILSAGAVGFHSDQWVKLFASEIQRKNTLINGLNSIEISNSVPSVGFSKIELFNRSISQRFFGRNRYNTRTRGRTFKVEKHGQFACFSWNEVGTEPYFVKTVELNDIDTSDISVTVDFTTSLVDYAIQSGSISFAGVQFGDIITITNFSAEGNNGAFKVLGVSADGKTVRVRNPNAVETAGNVNEIQSITFSSVPTVGDFTLNFDGQITGSIPYNAVAGDVETTLEALSNIDDVTVTGDFATGFVIEFLGVNSSTDVSSLVVETTTLDVAINEYERYDYTGLSGANFDDIAQVEELDFTNVTATNLDQTSLIEELDFTTQSLTGSIMNATQQAEEYNFAGIIGSDFDLGSTKSIQLADSLAYLWFNVTDGINVQSDPGGTGLGIQVDILSSDDADALSTKSKDAIDLATDGVKQVEQFDFDTLTGATIDAINQVEEFDFVSLLGSNFDTVTGKSIQLADGLAYVWYNVTDGANAQADPTGTGTSIQVDILAADNSVNIAAKTDVAISAALPIAGLLAPSSASGVLTVNYDTGVITTDGADVDTTAAYNKVRSGLDNNKSIQLAGSLAYVWFNTTDSSKTQIDPVGTGTGIQVDILTADLDLDLASKAETAINTASVVGISSSLASVDILQVTYDAANITDGSDVDSGAVYTQTENGVDITLAAGVFLTQAPVDVLTVVYDSGNITDGSDVDTGVTVTVIQEGLDAKSIQLAGNYAYLWYNVTDGSNTQTDPGGTGTAIEVSCLVADDDGVLATRSANAITAALPIAGIAAVSDALGVVTIDYDNGTTPGSTDYGTAININTTQTDVNSKSFQLGGNYAYLWFNVVNGATTQTDSGGNGTGIEVQILAADTSIAIATKAATAIDTAAAGILGLKSASNVDEVLTLNYELGAISNSSDVDSNVTSTETVAGVAAKSIQLADSLAYLWFDVTDGDNIQSNPGGSGTGIKVDILAADNAADIATKAATAIDTAAVVGIFDAQVLGNATNVFYTTTPTVIGSDVDTGVTITIIINATNSITIVEEVKGSLSGDFAVQTEVQEGDTVTISSDFTILNQGDYRVIRRFENSIYLDNPNVVEEEVTIGDNLITLGYDGSTDFDIDKLDGVSKIKWAGAGAEPVFEDTKSGNIITLGTDFNAANQGSFQIVDSGEKLQQITRFTQSRGVDMVSGQHGLINSAEDATNYYIWYNIQGAGGDPAPGGTGIEIPVLTADLAAEIAVKKADVINTFFSADFTAVVDGDDVIITTTGYGETTPSSNVDITGPFSLETTQVGRRNFADYINVAGVSETGVTISDVLEVHVEAMTFKEYEGVIAGDTFVISSNFLGENNVGSYVIQEVLSETEIIVSGVTESVSRTLLDSDFNKIYVEESTPYVGYKQIDLITTNPSNLNTKNVIFTTGNQFQKIGEIAGVSMTAVGKLEFPSEIIRGIDAYKFNTGLIGEANRIVYGEPRDNTTYPGVSAAGAEIFIKAPLVKRIEVSIDVRVKTGIPFTTIVEEVRSSIAALINSNPVGQPIAISNIISNVDAIVGIQAVAISSPQYDAQNDVIRINSGEKALVLDIIADILVSKIG